MRVNSAHVLISKSCVNNCVFCTVAERRRKHIFPEREEIIRFMRASAAAGTQSIVFSGMGEPTLDPHFEEYIALAEELAFNSISLFTNGYNLKKGDVQRWKDRGLSSVLISMHGMEEGHDRNVQRQGSFQEAVSAIRLYSEHAIAVSVNTCLTRLNLNEIPALCKFLENFPLNSHSLSFPEWSGNVPHYEQYILDYYEVSDIADNLIPEGNTVTMFEDMPYCLVRHRTREMQNQALVGLLDGTGEHEFQSNARKIFPESCISRECPFRTVCSGFEKDYIKARGWQDLKERTESFLDLLDDPDQRDLILAKLPDRPRMNRSGKEDRLRPDTGPDESLVVIVKPTNRCNAGCRYCSSFKETQSSDMSPDTLDRMYAELFEYAELKGKRYITFLWHGGEPLLLGKSFYEKAWSVTPTDKSIKIKHILQSNMLLLDDEWVQLFRRHNVHISTSVDPVGQDRILKDGSQQYPEWLDKFVLAASKGLHLGLVFTVTPSHIDRYADIYNFFKNMQSLSSGPLGVRLNPVYAAGAAAKLDQGDLISPDDYGEFLCRLWELWINDGKPFPLSPMSDWSEGRGSAICEFNGRCQENFIEVSGNGDVHHCGRFADAGLVMGNINTAKLEDILRHSHMEELGRRSELLKEGPCKGCPLWELCMGGCPCHAYAVFGEITRETPFCDAFRMFLTASGIGSAADRLEVD
jgi:uncharacterized protein